MKHLTKATLLLLVCLFLSSGVAAAGLCCLPVPAEVLHRGHCDLGPERLKIKRIKRTHKGDRPHVWTVS